MNDNLIISTTQLTPEMITAETELSLSCKNGTTGILSIYVESVDQDFEFDCDINWLEGQITAIHGMNQDTILKLDSFDLINDQLLIEGAQDSFYDYCEEEKISGAATAAGY